MTTRYRCTACGNLTRFDIEVSRRTRAFHHYTVGGDLEIEDEQVISREVHEVSCRWCGSPANVVEVTTQDAQDATIDGRDSQGATSNPR